MKVSIVVAMDQKRGIGKNNKLLWHISEDFKRFKTLTSGHPIIMGRKTWDSLPFKPLPNRTNIIVTRDKKQVSGFSFAGGRLAKLAGSLEEALRLASLAQGDDECFVIGGGQIYDQAIKKGLADKLYLTIVQGDFDADTFFPDYSEFKKVVFEKESQSEKYKYKFLELEK